MDTIPSKFHPPITLTTDFPKINLYVIHPHFLVYRVDAFQTISTWTLRICFLLSIGATYLALQTPRFQFPAIPDTETGPCRLYLISEYIHMSQSSSLTMDINLLLYITVYRRKCYSWQTYSTIEKLYYIEEHINFAQISLYSLQTKTRAPVFRQFFLKLPS